MTSYEGRCGESRAHDIEVPVGTAWVALVACQSDDLDHRPYENLHVVPAAEPHWHSLHSVLAANFSASLREALNS